MTKRIFIAASLLATVCTAQADVLPASSTSTQASFLDHWTDGKGNDIASSSVVGNNMRLVGGVALGNESAAQALLKKASADAASGTAVTIKRTDGISGTFALATSNYKAAAAAGDAVSVVTNSQGDLVITKGQAGGGSAGAPDGGAAGGAVGAGAGAGAGAGSGSGSASGSVSVVLPAGGSIATPLADPVAGNGTGAGAGAGGAAGASPSGEVPEPSTIALMLAGMAGAMSIARRRSR